MEKTIMNRTLRIKKCDELGLLFDNTIYVMQAPNNIGLELDPFRLLSVEVKDGQLSVDLQIIDPDYEPPDILEDWMMI